MIKVSGMTIDDSVTEGSEKSPCEISSAYHPMAGNENGKRDVKDETVPHENYDEWYIRLGDMDLLKLRNEILLADNRTLWADYRRATDKNVTLEKEIKQLNDEADLLAEEGIVYEQKWRNAEVRLKKKEERIALYNSFVVCLEKILSPTTYENVAKALMRAFRH